MPPAVYRFGDFLLDPHERRLVRAGEGVELPIFEPGVFAGSSWR